MQRPARQISQRLGVAALAVAGLIAATAHAKDLSAAPTATLLDEARQCSDVDAILAKLQFPAGTTFLLTEAGLVVLSQAKAVGDPLPDWPPSTAN